MSKNTDIDRGKFDWFIMDKIDVLWWGLAFLWSALLILSANLGWFARSVQSDTWGIFFTGLGIFALICTAIRLQMPAFRGKWTFSAVFSMIYLAIGLSTWQAGWWIWVVFLATIGAAAIVSVFTRQA